MGERPVLVAAVYDKIDHFINGTPFQKGLILHVNHNNNDVIINLIS